MILRRLCCTRAVATPPFVTLLLAVALALLLSACAMRADVAPSSGVEGSVEDAGQGDENETMEEAEAGDDEGAMDHGNMEMDDSIPTDAAFLDSMIVHHEGAVSMAQELLANTERPELEDLANAIIATQSVEIDQMQSWREEWYPDLADSDGMDMEMGAMSVSDDEAQPYDKRFLDAMIDHHEGAIAMAESILEESDREEIRSLAEGIISAQETEIAQMSGWLQEWFGE